MVYDAAGNVTNDGLGNTYTYDAENRVTSLSGNNSASYVYDAFGHRVRATISSVPYDFLYSGGRAVDEYTSSGWVWGDAGAAQLAVYANSTTYFSHNDWLGSLRAWSNVSGSSVETCTTMPFGDAQTCTGTAPNSWNYTGLPFDTESGMSHALFRQLSTTEGRWTTSDPAGLGAVDPTNPQTWNRYAYVGNNPLSRTDPLGLFYCACELDDGGDDGGGGGDPSGGDPCFLYGMDCPGQGPSGPPGLPGGGGGVRGKPCLAGAGPLLPGQSRCAAGNSNSPCNTLNNFNQTTNRILAGAKAFVNAQLALPKVIGGALGELVPGLEAPSSYEIWNGFWQGVNAGNNAMYAVTGNANYANEANSATMLATGTGIVTYTLTGNVYLAATIGSFENMTSPVDAGLTLVELGQSVLTGNVPCQAPVATTTSIPQ